MNGVDTIDKRTIELHKAWRLIKLLNKESGEVKVRVAVTAEGWRKACILLQGLPDIPVQAYIEIENEQYEPALTYPPGGDRLIDHSATYTPPKEEEAEDLIKKPEEPKKEPEATK
jgi:hypothetical protein